MIYYSAGFRRILYFYILCIYFLNNLRHGILILIAIVLNAHLKPIFFALFLDESQARQKVYPSMIRLVGFLFVPFPTSSASIFKTESISPRDKLTALSGRIRSYRSLHPPCTSSLFIHPHHLFYLHLPYIASHLHCELIMSPAFELCPAHAHSPVSSPVVTSADPVEVHFHFPVAIVTNDQIPGRIRFQLNVAHLQPAADCISPQR